jgi:hypothetical protein
MQLLRFSRSPTAPASSLATCRHPERRLTLLLMLATSACSVPGTPIRLDSAATAATVISPALVPVARSSAAAPALALGNDGERLVGAPLDAVLRWHDPAPGADAALAAPIVIASEGERLSARAAPTGGGFWSIPEPEGRVTSAADDGTWTAVGFRLPERGENRVIVYDREGTPVVRLESKERLGTPALIQGRLYLPWGQATLSVIDLKSRSELGRVQLPSRIDHAFATPRDALFLVSGQSFIPFTAGPIRGFGLPARPMPSAPAELVPFGFAPLLASPGAQSTATRLPPRLVADPARVSDRAGHYLYVDDRISLGLNLASARLDWLHVAPQRVLGAAALESGFLLCDAAGTLFVLSDDGRVSDRIQLSPGKLQSCAVRPGRLRTPDSLPAAGTPLIAQLRAALVINDPALVDLQRFLLTELAARSEPEATQLLLEIAGSPTTQLTLQRDAGDLLGLRRNGVEYMLEALGKDVSTGSPPPVRALADALAALNESRATPLLVQQLNNPAHSSETIAHVMGALEKLAGPGDYEPLRVFFVLHRAMADDPHWTQAVISAARTLVRIGGEPGRSVVRLAADDPLTTADVRTPLVEMLSAPAADAQGEAEK